MLLCRHLSLDFEAALSLSYGKCNTVNNFKGGKKHSLANDPGQCVRKSEQIIPKLWLLKVTLVFKHNVNKNFSQRHGKIKMHDGTLLILSL